MKKTDKLQKYSAPALEKGLDILEFLSLTEETPTLSQIAGGIGRTKSEIFRMMIVLEEREYIERLDGDCFRVTGKLSGIGGDRTLNNRIAALATPLLFSLTETTGLSSHLSIIQDNKSLVIANASVVDSYGLSVQIGRKADLSDTSVAACFEADETTQESVPSQQIDYSPSAGLPAQSFRQAVEDCVMHGYATLPSPENQTILEMSAPVRHLLLNKTIASITIPFFAGEPVSNRVPSIVSALAQCIEVLQEKIAVTLPQMQS